MLGAPAARTVGSSFCSTQRLVTILVTTALVIGLQKVFSAAFLGSLSPTFYRRASFGATAGGKNGYGIAGGGNSDRLLKPEGTSGSGSVENCPKCPQCEQGGGATTTTSSAPAASGEKKESGKEQPLSPTTGLNLFAENPWLTQQQCFENSDETEICIWRGPVCITSKDEIIVSRERRPDYGSHDPRSWCPDHRAYRRTYECKNKRPNLPEEAYKNPDKWMHGANSIPLMPNERRRWGAQDSQGDIREVPFEALIRGTGTPEEIEGILGPGGWAEVARKAEFSHLPKEAGESLGIGSINMPKKVRWLGGNGAKGGGEKGVYFANMRGEWIDHIWHWSTAAFPLFDAKRQNRSTLNVPGFSMEPGHFNLNMGKLSLPPMDFVVMFGRFPRPVRSITDFPRWMQKVWPALSQEQTVLLANGVFTDKSSPYHLPEDELLCTTHAVFSSFKSSLFTGQRDAHVFKQLAYAKAGVTVPAYGRYPPRQITVMTRSSRGLYNIEEILAVLKDTGLPVKVISDMGALTWEQQVQVMAETGILVAVHGAALTNVAFMPANAVLIEVFPWSYRSFLYRDLAWKAGLQYYPLNSVWPDFGGRSFAEMKKTPKGSGVYEIYEEEEFIKKCSGPHFSGMDVYSIAECTHRAKYTFPFVSIPQLKTTIWDALDDIGCRDSFCHQVKHERNDMPPEFHITDMKKNETRVYIP